MRYCSPCAFRFATWSLNPLPQSCALHEPRLAFLVDHHVLEECCSLLDMSQLAPSRASNHAISPICPHFFLARGGFLCFLDHFILPAWSELLIEMALAHASSVYSHGFANYSTTSFSSTSHSSRPDVNSLKHVFSSRLAECYARDEISGQRSCLKSGYKNKGTDNGRVQYRQHVARIYPMPIVRCGRRLDPRTLHSDYTEHQSEYTQQEPSSPKAFSISLNRDALRPLLSPICFTPPTDASEASDPTGSRLHDEFTEAPCRKRIESPAAAPFDAEDSNRCSFPFCEPETSITRDRFSKRRLTTKYLETMSMIKPRAVSLGEGLRSSSTDDHHIYQEPHGGRPRKSLHRTTGSRELRRSAGSPQVNRDCAPWVDQIRRATEYASSYQPCQETNMRGLPRHGRPRLWLDATKNEGRIEEAVS